MGEKVYRLEDACLERNIIGLPENFVGTTDAKLDWLRYLSGTTKGLNTAEPSVKDSGPASLLSSSCKVSARSNSGATMLGRKEQLIISSICTAVGNTTTHIHRQKLPQIHCPRPQYRHNRGESTSGRRRNFFCSLSKFVRLLRGKHSDEKNGLRKLNGPSGGHELHLPRWVISTREKPNPVNSI